MRTRTAAVLVALLLSVAGCGAGGNTDGDVDRNDPSYIDGYRGGLNLVRTLGSTERSAPLCDESLRLVGLIGGVSGGNSALARIGCFDAIYDSNNVPSAQRSYIAPPSRPEEPSPKAPSPLPRACSSTARGCPASPAPIPPGSVIAERATPGPSQKPACLTTAPTVPAGGRVTAAEQTYRVPLTANIGYQDVSECYHLLVDRLDLSALSADGYYSGDMRVTNPMSEPIQVVLEIVLVDDQLEIAGDVSDGPCLPPGGSEVMSVGEVLRADEGASYSDVQISDYSSTVGC